MQKKKVGVTVLEVIKNKTNLNQKGCFVLTYYDLDIRKRERKDINIPSVLKVTNHFQHLVGFFTGTPDSDTKTIREKLLSGSSLDNTTKIGMTTLTHLTTPVVDTELL